MVLVGTVAGLAGCNFAVISELGVGVHLFDGSSVVMASGAADAARFSRHRLERDHGRGSADAWVRARDVQLQPPARRRGLGALRPGECATVG